VDEDTGIGGRRVEKHAILAKAWDQFRRGRAVTKADLELEYATDEDGIKHLTEHPVFSGIDQGEGKPEEADDSPTPEEVEAEKKRIREEKAQADAACIAQLKAAKERAEARKNGTASAKKPVLAKK